MKKIRIMIYVLELEEEGDYDDNYQRPTEVIAASIDKNKLQLKVDNFKSFIRERDNTKLFIYQGNEYIDYNIYKVDLIE